MENEQIVKAIIITMIAESADKVIDIEELCARISDQIFVKLNATQAATAVVDVLQNVMASDPHIIVSNGLCSLSSLTLLAKQKLLTNKINALKSLRKRTKKPETLERQRLIAHAYHEQVELLHEQIDSYKADLAYVTGGAL